jgi:uncharacterized protein DUF5367
MNLNSGSYMSHRLLFTGALLWVVGTVAIRLGGRGFLHANRPVTTLILYLASFAMMALLVPRIFRRLGVEENSWPAAATLLMLPTLILDPFSCAFFSTVFPEVEPGAVGVFGGWMLIFCAGAVLGVWLTPGVRLAVRAGDKP